MNTNHYVDTYHLLKNIKRKTSKKTNIVYYQRLLKSRNMQEYESHFRELLKFEENLELAKNFDSNNSSQCFSHADSSFVGFSLSSSRSEKINDIIKSHIKR